MPEQLVSDRFYNAHSVHQLAGDHILDTMKMEFSECLCKISHTFELLD
jgi:hypothetical protein